MCLEQALQAHEDKPAVARWINKANGVTLFFLLYQTLGRRTVLKASSFPGEHSGLEPPDPFSNSVVKHSCANDSVRSPHAKVGHRQVFIKIATSTSYVA